MSIIKIYDVYHLACDICGNTAAPEDSFDGAVEAKKHGWRSRRDDVGEWQDICPECRELE